MQPPLSLPPGQALTIELYGCIVIYVCSSYRKTEGSPGLHQAVYHKGRGLSHCEGSGPAFRVCQSPLSTTAYQCAPEKRLDHKSPSQGQKHQANRAEKTSGRSISLLGKVRAGKPILVAEETEVHITVDSHIFRHKNAFALSVTGDSMIEEGILEDDIVIVKQEKDPLNGCIAVVLIQDEVTVKFFFKEGKLVRLVPANRLLKPMLVDARDVMVLGRVVGVIRKL